MPDNPPFHKSKTTLCFLLRNDEILLSLKKRGFGSGKWNGVGGKLEENETVEEAIRREAKEEIGVELKDLTRIAALYFYFSEAVGPLGTAEETAVFFCKNWVGDPIETEEMKPKWFKQKEIPYNSMWEDDIFWLPRVLRGERITGKFWFDKSLQLLRHKIAPL